MAVGTSNAPGTSTNSTVAPAASAAAVAPSTRWSAMLVLVGVYSTLSGLWGVAVTDAIQFVLAMAGCIALAGVAPPSGS